ncbi:MAG TPA: hypothetical protein VE549_12515 [Myxococcaceae bacterium]|nr:hypothetical protein [Myxococcaceae bacterium]
MSRSAPGVAAAAPRTARDFYSELIKDTQSGRAGFLLEREQWLRALHADGTEERLFEFEMLLRGIERYFNFHNLGFDLADGPLVTRNFRDELGQVRDAVNEAIRAARQLLDPDSDQRMVFRRYIESTVADDRARRMLAEENLGQDTPQESLFVLRQSFAALRTVIDHLLELPACPLAVYGDVGSLLLREIVLNRYFRPFRPLEFRLEYDRIHSVRILEALGALPEGSRRLFTVAFLALFRLLHYLSYAGEDRAEPPPPRARVILALVRSEAGSLALFLEEDVAVRAELKRHKAAALRAARELMRETKRISREVLAPARELADLFRRQIIALARALEGADVRRIGNGAHDASKAFEALVSSSEIAERLRLDLWALAGLCEAATRALRKPNRDKAESALGAVRAYLQYFHGVSYQLLRYRDYDSLDRLAALVGETERVPDDEDQRAALADALHRFSEVARALSSEVARRADLSGVPLDRAEVKALVARFRGSHAPADDA